MPMFDALFREFRCHWFCAVLLACAAGPVAAQAFPSKPIRLVVAFAPGSGNDNIARELARHMGEQLGQPIVVDNRPGGGGSIGTDVVAKAAADGYTIGLGTSSQLVMNVGLYKTLPFDVDKDLRSIGLVSRTPMVLVAGAAAPASLKALIAEAQARPGRISYGSAGIGSISHIVAEAFARATDLRLLHVPYKGNGAALVDLAGGQVQLVFDGFLSARPLVQQGRVRLLAVSAERRSRLEPDVPTFAELGLHDYQAYTWNSLIAPARTPQAIIDRFNTALNQALALPALRERLAQSASDSLAPSTPAQADAFGLAERTRWVPFVRALRLDPL